MNLVFVGASKFGFRCLESCHGSANISVVGVVTAPKTFEISYQPEGVNNVLYADLATFADSHCIPVRTIERSMNDRSLFETVSNWQPDAFLVAGWYHMIPKSWRKIAPAYGLHASLLPDYSGGAPLVWAMINGEAKTGISLFQMDDGVDSGPIAGQKEEYIKLQDTIATLYERIELRGLELLRETLPKLAEGSLQLVPQDENKRRLMPQRSPEDGRIDWSQDAATLDRFIRAQTRPYPGAFTTLEAKPLHIWRAQVALISNSKPEIGLVYRTDLGTYIVGCRGGAIILNEITYEQRTYTQTNFTELFGGGGQRLGATLSCLPKSEP